MWLVLGWHSVLPFSLYLSHTHRRTHRQTVWGRDKFHSSVLSCSVFKSLRPAGALPAGSKQHPSNLSAVRELVNRYCIDYCNLHGNSYTSLTVVHHSERLQSMPYEFRLRFKLLINTFMDQLVYDSCITLHQIIWVSLSETGGTCLKKISKVCLNEWGSRILCCRWPCVMGQTGRCINGIMVGILWIMEILIYEQSKASKLKF